MAVIATIGISCGSRTTTDSAEKPWIVDKFDDAKVLRYEVPGFESLPLEEKMLIYYLSESAACGRDIVYDQNFKYNLTIRRTLEAIYENYEGDKNSTEWLGLEKYLKKMWFANGIHHHYSNEKFKPEFTKGYMAEVMSQIPYEKFPQDFDSMEGLQSVIFPIIFDSELYKYRLDQRDGIDVITSSCGNYYAGVTQPEVEKFYAAMTDVNDKEPISYGLNSQLTKDASGNVYERVWKIGSMYTESLEKVVYWLEKAASVAKGGQKQTIEKLISFYKTGNLREFDEFNIMWAKDTVSNVDFVNGFTESYGDPLGRKASWESVVNFRDEEACHRTKVIADNAQWFEDNSPVAPQYKKKVVKGISAKVITVATLGGDCYPTTPIGINLPNANWIRKEHGSKSVTMDNITYAYAKSAEGNGFQEEFVLREEDRARMKEYGKLADNLHTDLHECLGHGSGQLAPGVTGDELKTYSAALEETRADLYALYYLGSDKMIEIGLVPSFEVAEAQYASYVMNGMMTQLARIELGKNVEQTHMRNRKTISEWAYDLGKKDNVIEWVEKDGKKYVVVNDFKKLHSIFGVMLKEIQRIKSEGDYAAGRNLIEKYGVKIDYDLHKQLLDRYAALKIEPYSGFVNPKFELVEKDGKVVDVKVSYPANYVEQQLEYSHKYSFLPNIN